MKRSKKKAKKSFKLRTPKQQVESARPKTQNTKPSKKKNKRRDRAPKGRAGAKKNSARNYSIATIKELFGLNGNQCAFPGCPNQIIVEDTKLSKAAAVGHICHINAASAIGPRGKSGLTDKRRRSSENLILLCGHHHALVDKQPEDYPASKLIEWKQKRIAQFTNGTAEAIEREAAIQKHAFVEQMSDAQIEKGLTRVRWGRGLAGFRVREETLAFATQVDQSRYSAGSDLVRARALAWCARILSQGDTKDRARELLQKSVDIALTPEAQISEAFLRPESEKVKSLAQLAKMRTPAAYSAALRLVTKFDGPQSALDWAVASGLSVESFDPEGRLTLVQNALLSERWAVAFDAAEKITEADFQDSPHLFYIVGMSRLCQTVPEELRSPLLFQVPFEANTFPLVSNTEQLALRRLARELFERAATLATDLGATDVANSAADYALWLRLRDPAEHDDAMCALHESMREPVTSIRRVNLAIRFGLKLDFDAIERRLDQNIALSGEGSGEEAYARLALAFTKRDPKAAADYMEKHRALIYRHLQKNTVVGLEIELLARAGLISTAREKLAEAERNGLGAHDKAQLDRILSELSGSDPIAERRALFESSGDLRSLVNLADGLEKAGLWQDLLPFAQELFKRVASVENYERLVHCLNDLGRYDELLESLTANAALIDQSQNLKAVWAWTLYREGRFAEANEALARLSNGNDTNARALRVNVAVASGAWDKLLEYCNEIWTDRDRYSAADLLRAAQLSIAVNGPHSRELAKAAVEKEPENPNVLLAAYTQATSGGWEHDEIVAGWMNSAIRLSGTKGPIKRMSLKELVDQKPGWDKQALDASDMLRKGKMPALAVGRILNRSLLDFYLVPSLANPLEPDVRKRTVVFAYSGARRPRTFEHLKTLALDLAAIVTFARLGLLDKVLARYQIVVPHSTMGWLLQERQEANFHQPSRIEDAALLKQLIASGTLRVAHLPASRDFRLTAEVGAELSAMLTAAKEKTTSENKSLVVRSPPLHKLSSLMSEQADVSAYTDYLCSCSGLVDYLKRKGVLTQPEAQRAMDFLQLHEGRWPSEPSIDGKSDLYLDDLAVSHLRAAGVLEKFGAAGLSAYIAETEDSEANALLKLRNLGNQQLATIEEIRSALSSAIASGRVRAVRTLQGSDEDDSFHLHPTFGTLGLAKAADAIVVDDRYVNQHPTMTHEGHTVPVLSSLDVMDMLHSAGDISKRELYDYRTTLRRSGYQFIPLTDDELAHHLANTEPVDNWLVETAELKAVRESLLRARMGSLVQIPGEEMFLHDTLGAYIRALKRVWVIHTDRAVAEAHAGYLLSQVDIRVWAASAPSGNERGFALYAYATYALQIMGPPTEADKATRDAYYDWITRNFLQSIKDYQPEMYDWIVARSREFAANAVEKNEADI